MIPLTEDGLVRLDSLPCGVYRFTEDVSKYRKRPCTGTKDAKDSGGD